MNIGVLICHNTWEVLKEAAPWRQRTFQRNQRCQWEGLVQGKATKKKGSTYRAIAGGFWKRLVVSRCFLRGTICLLSLGHQPLQGPQDLLAGGYLLRFLCWRDLLVSVVLDADSRRLLQGLGFHGARIQRASAFGRVARIASGPWSLEIAAGTGLPLRKAALALGLIISRGSRAPNKSRTEVPFSTNKIVSPPYISASPSVPFPSSESSPASSGSGAIGRESSSSRVPRAKIRVLVR